MTDTTTFRPGQRVVCPGGIQGTIEKMSTRPNARWPYLVKRDDGLSKSYAASELRAVGATGPGVLRPYP